MAMLNKYVVVRSVDAGVHVGVLIERDANVVLLHEARRIRTWKGALTLSEIANHGVGKGSQIAEVVRAIYIRNWCELTECSEEGEKNLRSAVWGK